MFIYNFLQVAFGIDVTRIWKKRDKSDCIAKLIACYCVPLFKLKQGSYVDEKRQQFLTCQYEISYFPSSNVLNVSFDWFQFMPGKT